MKNKGFTLVELLSVVVLISLIMVIVVPQVQKVSNNSKVKLCNTKMELVVNALDIWGTNNRNCFSQSGGCKVLDNCKTNGNIITCNTTFGKLASNNIISYDEGTDVINPIYEEIESNKRLLNNTTIQVKYNTNNKTATTSIDTDNICKMED